MDSIIVQSINIYEQNVLFAAGHYTKIEEGTTLGFFYAIDYDWCTTLLFFEFPNVNQGFSEMSYLNDYVYLLGYHLDPDTEAVYETIIKMNMWLDATQ